MCECAKFRGHGLVQLKLCAILSRHCHYMHAGDTQYALLIMASLQQWIFEQCVNVLRLNGVAGVAGGRRMGGGCTRWITSAFASQPNLHKQAQPSVLRIFWTLFAPFQPCRHSRHLDGDDGDLVGGWSGACVEDMP